MAVSRVFAAVIAIVAAFGLAVQFTASVGLTGSAPAAVWAMLRYFTVLTNLGICLLMAAIAAGVLSLRRSFLIGGVSLAMSLVGLVYFFLLRGLVELSGGALLADFLLHTAVPLLTALFWVAVVPKGALRWRDPLLWTFYPLAYLLYAVLRGGLDGKYPYPFIDIGDIGAGVALLNSAGIAIAFILGGLLLVAIDAALGQRTSNR